MRWSCTYVCKYYMLSVASPGTAVLLNGLLGTQYTSVWLTVLHLQRPTVMTALVVTPLAQIYTIWNYRREALQPVFEAGGDAAAAASEAELALTQVSNYCR